MIPLCTDRATRRTPFVTFLLIAANVLVMLAISTLERRNPERAHEIVASFWVLGGDFHWYSLWTSAFLHAGLLHLLGNMLFLWVFGPGVEDRLGHVGFTVLYAAGAAGSAGAHAFFEDAPAIGASGAVAAVTGAFLVMLPRTQVKILFFFLYIGVVWIPSTWFIAFGIAKDLLMHAMAPNNGIANLAHLAGYVTGAGVATVLLATRIIAPEPYDLVTAFRQSKRRAALRRAHEAAQRDIRRVQVEGPDKAFGEREASLAAARRKVVDRLAARDPAGAASAYRDLVDGHGVEAGALGSQTLTAIGNACFERGDHSTAAVAYERFLANYTDDREAPRVTLMLGLILGKYLNDPIRAKQVLTESLKMDLDDEHKALATQWLADLG